jgi:hypothetical protein
VLNRPEFAPLSDGTGLKGDRCGQIRELEFIALPGSRFRIVAEVAGAPVPVYRVETDEYPSPAGGLFVDGRFLERSDGEPPPRQRILPERHEIVAAMRAAVGSPYVWGGNLAASPQDVARRYPAGIPAWQGAIPQAGLDCSGLLYYATNGWTPRNTNQLVDYGEPVKVAGKGVEEIVAALKPLDLLAWEGHLVIVLDPETAIESRLECGKKGNGGVVTTPLLQRVRAIMKTRRPVNAWPKGGRRKDVFVVRRWHGDTRSSN